MEPARLGTAPRRPRRGSVESPIDMRLVRKVSLVLVAPVALAILTLARFGPLPAPALPPSFDQATAVALTEELVSENPNRVPGTLESAQAVEWLREKLAFYGLALREDRWRQDVPGVGDVELRNLAAVVPGTLEQTIVVVANRDNNGRSAGASIAASGRRKRGDEAVSAGSSQISHARSSICLVFKLAAGSSDGWQRSDSETRSMRSGTAAVGIG